jgi:hypothetical protein
MPNTNSGNELIFNGGTLSSGGKENNFGRLSITENSKINLRFIDIHKLTFATGGSFKSGKKVVIYGWSGLTGGVLTPAGKIESTNVSQASVYLRSSGKTASSKSGGVQASGQIVSVALGVDFNGRIYMNSTPQLTQFQKDRIRFYYDKNDIEYSTTQAAGSAQGSELLAENPIAIEPSTAFVGSTLTTTAITSPTNTTAVSGGNITAALNDSVLVRGVVWSTSTNPTVDLLTKTIDGSGKGSFTSNLSGLTAGTTYYVRAYATNSNSTDYGTQVSFTTLRTPDLSATSAPSSITYSSVIAAGDISTNNGLPITARGFVYALASTTSNPTLSNSSILVSGTATGSFTGTVTGLIDSRLYYISTYATNSSGTNYGTPISFTTSSAPAGSGLTSATAATSAKAILTSYPSSPDGAYWIQNANINSGTPFQIYADMTTNGGGWMLLNLSGGGVASTEISSITALSNFGYLSRTTVIALANISTDVRLTSGPLSNKIANIAISSDLNPITALRSSISTTNGQGTWHYNSSSSFTVNAGSWSWSNQSGVANGWPNMYHSSGCGSCVHWLPSYADGAGKDWASGNYYSTWIR